MAFATFAFYFFAIVAVVAGVLVIFARNPVHSVLWLILAFFAAAGLFVLLGAEFVAMLMLIVYVGAVAVLFLFVVMMLDVDFAELRAGMWRLLPVGLLIALVLLVQLGFVFGGWQVSDQAIALRAAATPPAAAGGEHRGAGDADLHPLRLPVPGGGADPPGGDDRGDRADPAQAGLGQAAGRAGADVPRPQGRGGAEGHQTGAGGMSGQ